MRRRDFSRLLGSLPLAVAFGANAQQPGKIPVVGTIWHAGSEQEENPWFGYQRQAFAELGYILGKNILFEDRYAAEIPERYDIVAAELVRLNVDIIFANIFPSTAAAKRATSTIPIVFMVADPVRMGVVPSLAHPGGNATGVSYMTIELNPKRLELFKEAIPSLSRVALLVHADNKYLAELDMNEYVPTAKTLGITIEAFQGRNVEELKSVFSKIAQLHFDGLIIGNYPLYAIRRRELQEMALGAGLPTLAISGDESDAGALLSYSAPVLELYRAAAVLVKRILGGEKPSDLAVQRPTKFELVLNMKTAKALGLTFSQQFLARVDRVIE